MDWYKVTFNVWVPGGAMVKTTSAEEAKRLTIEAVESVVEVGFPSADWRETIYVERVRDDETFILLATGED